MLKKQQGKNVPVSLLDYAERLTQEMAILLEPDGCMPQISGITKRINMRETVFWASRIFDRDDFRFIAYGGLRMPDSYPPSVTSVFLKDRNVCVMRSSWNICIQTNEVNDKWLGNDSASMTMDLATGDISFFGYNHPLIISRIDNYGALVPEKTVWKSNDIHDYLYIETDRLSAEIYFLVTL